MLWNWLDLIQKRPWILVLIYVLKVTKLWKLEYEFWKDFDDLMIETCWNLGINDFWKVWRLTDVKIMIFGSNPSRTQLQIRFRRMCSFVCLIRTNEASFVRQKAHSRECGVIRIGFIRIRSHSHKGLIRMTHSHEWAFIRMTLCTFARMRYIRISHSYMLSG